MFDQTCLYDKPLIQMRQSFKGDLPESFRTLYSSQFWFYLDNDFIEKVVTLRVYPYQNCIALKLKPRGPREFLNIMLKDPELRILKRVWDCGNAGFNIALKYYMIHSVDTFQQWTNKAEQSKHCLDWY